MGRNKIPTRKGGLRKTLEKKAERCRYCVICKRTTNMPSLHF